MVVNKLANNLLLLQSNDIINYVLGTFLLLFVGFTLSVKSNDIECWTCNSAKLKNTTCINGTCSISDVFGCSLKSCNQNCTNYCYSSLSKDEVTSGCTFLQVSL